MLDIQQLLSHGPGKGEPLQWHMRAEAHRARQQLCFEDLHRQQAKRDTAACPGTKGSQQHPELYSQKHCAVVYPEGS